MVAARFQRSSRRGDGGMKTREIGFARGPSCWASRSFAAPPSAAQSNRSIELASSVDDGFTIAVVGDIIIAHSLEHMMSNPRFAEVVGVLQKRGTSRPENLETQIIDGRSWVGRRGRWHPRGGARVRRVAQGDGLRHRRATEQPRQRFSDTTVSWKPAGIFSARDFRTSGFGDSYWASRSARFHTTSARDAWAWSPLPRNGQPSSPGPGRGGPGPAGLSPPERGRSTSWSQPTRGMP